MCKSKVKRRVLIADDMSPLAQECFKQAGIEIDRKMLADIAVRERVAFKALVDKVQAALAA